jgi:cell division protein FtsW (lipid II flippase)
VPIVGITLPFASYGGSSLLTSFIILGIISSMKFDFKKNKSLEIT